MFNLNFASCHNFLFVSISCISLLTFDFYVALMAASVTAQIWLVISSVSHLIRKFLFTLILLFLGLEDALE